MLLCISSCRHKEPAKNEAKAPKEDLEAKKLLQGVWMNEDDETVVFKAHGDTIYYPDSTSQPVYFQIFGDTLVLYSANSARYKIVKQSPHVFEFRNAAGDLVSLVKSEDREDNDYFSKETPMPLNTGKLIKRDSVLIYGKDRYHSYIQINPTTFKVVKANYSDEGVEVDNVYYDNIVNLNVYHGATKLFSGDFRKQQFKHIVPNDFLSQAILSDLIFDSIDKNGVHYVAVLVIPDSMSSYEVLLTVSYTGHLQMRLK